MAQPVFVRKKYYKQMQAEIEKREEKLNQRKGTAKKGKGGPTYSKNSRSINPADIVSGNK